MMFRCKVTFSVLYIHLLMFIIYDDDDDDDDDEIRVIRHRYKVMTLLVSARKINNNNKIQQPQ